MRQHLPLSLLLVGLAVAAAAAGCSSSADDTVCRVGADCASGVCLPTGLCQPEGGPDAAPGDLADADPNAPDAATAACTPSGDFQIDRDEVVLASGLAATFAVALDATVDTAGSDAGGGARAWSLAGALPGDTDVPTETLPVAGQWFAAVFPGATYATRLSGTNDLLGVFEATENHLLLRGVVSPADGLDRTELVYDPPAKVLQFPVKAGLTWSTTSTITGVTQGIATYATEIWDASADAHGALATPYGDFERVVRVHVELTRSVGALITVTQTHAFVTECFGTVATVRSKDNHFDTEFTDAAEVRRIAP